MAKVTFTCACPESIVSASVENGADGSSPQHILFEESGKKTLVLDAGTYDVAYRAQGPASTPFSLTVTDGGTMPPVIRTLPASGKAAGVRTLTVRAMLLPLALFVAHPSAGRAQPAGASAERRTQAERSLATLPNIGDVLGPGYFLALEASSDSKTGTATVSVSNQPGSFTASLSLEGPLSGSTKTARPLTPDGLANNGAGTVALHWFYWPNAPDVASMRGICQRVLHKNDCDDDELTNVDDRRAFMRFSHASDTPTVVNARVGIGRRAFTYVDRTTLASASEGHNQIDAALGAGHYAPAVGYVAASYHFEREFEAGDSEQLCTLNAAGGIFECKDAVVGAPGRSTRHGASIEWRRFLPGGRVAIDPAIARDFRGRVSSANLPIYFLGAAAGGLAGGARASWRSDEKGVAVSIFVGAALHLTE